MTETTEQTIEITESQTDEKPQNAYFLSLELENVRCFKEKQKIDFSDGNGNWKRWTIILGDNGTGKTTCLLVLSSYFPQANLHYFFELFGLKDFKVSFMTSVFLGINREIITEQETKKINVNLKFSKTKEIKNYCAYGASRKAGRTSLSEQNDELAYKTLFSETALLLNPEEWLLRAKYLIYANNSEDSCYYEETEEFLHADKMRNKRVIELEQVKDILKKVLPDVDEIRFGEKELEGKRIPQPIVEFLTPYGWVEAKDLSLGYRTSMAWVVDFASRMFDAYPESENPLAEPAVCLVDEIDLHLHPRWQREIIDHLSKNFPQTQFIVTTHSPLIVQAAAARDANFVVCKREGDHVVIDQSIEAVESWRVDQFLTSDLFGLETARSKEFEERRNLLSKAKRTKREEKRLAELEKKFESISVSDNPEDDKAMDIIRRAAKRLESQA